MSAPAHEPLSEQKSVNFWGPVVGGLIVWLIILIIETNLDENQTSDIHTSEPHVTQIK